MVPMATGHMVTEPTAHMATEHMVTEHMATEPTEQDMLQEVTSTISTSKISNWVLKHPVTNTSWYMLKDLTQL